jgi:hypothetical protein
MNNDSTIFINPKTNKIAGHENRIYNSGEPLRKIPNFIKDENNKIIGVEYIDPIFIVTGYNPEFKYKTYNPETNSFI